jgi:hypothetical protein
MRQIVANAEGEVVQVRGNLSDWLRLLVRAIPFAA